MARSAVRLVCLLPLLALAAACREAPAPDAVAVAPTPTAEPAAIDWGRCQFEGVSIPVGGKLFVVDGGPPPDDAEPGRESIRRVEVVVPGPVALLLTASDPTVWMVRASPETQIRAIFATGDQPQRIAGQGLGAARLERSAALGDACGHYLLPDGPGPALLEAANQVFGRPHDAIYHLHGGRAIIGDPNEPPAY
jgi:hypothetical protein